MEDILTSNVFGVFKYVPLQDGLLPFLARAEASDGRQPLRFLFENDGAGVALSGEMSFWPSWMSDDCNGCEPDVVIALDCPNRKPQLICIEAKYLSGKSSDADETDERPTDQLAREWDNLWRIAGEGCEPTLIYLTADIGCPVVDIEASVVEFKVKYGSSKPSPNILWLSWRLLSTSLGTKAYTKDLAELMRRLGLIYFTGFGALDSKPLGWCFSEVYRWSVCLSSRADWVFTP